MKLRISTILLGASMLMAGTSCIKKDNYPGPNASLSGSLFLDGSSSKTTVQTSTGNFSIRLEELSYSATPAPQDIPVKNDGTYENDKLFSGHYRVSLHGGAFWPVAPVETDIRQGSRLDFQLTPYLILNNFKATLTDTVLALTADLTAPIDGGIPQLIEVDPYVNTTEFVGPGAAVYQFSESQKLSVPSASSPWDWSSMTPAQRSIGVTVTGLIRGRTFFVRLGVKFNNDDKSSNLSEVIRVDVPKQ